MGGGRREAALELRTASKIGLASLSAAVAETATFPIDILKTRLQLCGESSRPPSRTRPLAAAGGNSLRVAAEIWRKGGVLGFYSGLSPAVLRHLFYTPIRIVSYEHLRVAAAPDGSLLGKALAGGVSGVIAQVTSEIPFSLNTIDSCALQILEMCLLHSFLDSYFLANGNCRKKKSNVDLSLLLLKVNFSLIAPVVNF